MPDNLFLLQGKIEKIQISRQCSIDWHDNRMHVIKRIAVNEYSATLNNLAIKFVLSQHYMSPQIDVNAVAFKKKKYGKLIVIALKHHQLMYLSPDLHDRAINVKAAFPIKLWHIGVAAIWGVFLFLNTDTTLYGGILGCFSVFAMSCIISGYIELRDAAIELKSLRLQILEFYGLPLKLEDKIFQKKWGYQDAIGVVDLIKVNDTKR